MDVKELFKCVAKGGFPFFWKPCDLMMVFYYFYILILGAFYLTSGDYQTCNKEMLENSKELVEIGVVMGTIHHIKPMGVEACICKSESMMVYL